MTEAISGTGDRQRLGLNPDYWSAVELNWIHAAAAASAWPARR